MATDPLVSVVMAVYNERPYLEGAVRSILDQTFHDFEFIIINDGSTDGTEEVLERFADRDDRVRVLHQENRGLIASLNRGLSKAHGAFVARMDGDDLSHPERFERQVQFLRSNPEVGGVGTKIEYIDAEGQVTGAWPLPTDPDIIAWRLLFNTCLCNPSVMMRHSLLDKLGGYAEWPEYAEDYELWTRVVQQSKLANVPDKLFKLRRHKRSVTVSKRERQIHTCGAIAAKLHKALLGQQVAEKIPEFLVWMEAVGVKRAVRETGVENMTTVHRYTRALYESCARQLLSEGSNVRVRQQALPKLDAIANLIYEREGWVQGALHKLKARFMSPAHEIFPWILRAMRHRIY